MVGILFLITVSRISDRSGGREFYIVSIIISLSRGGLQSAIPRDFLFIVSFNVQMNLLNDGYDTFLKFINPLSEKYGFSFSSTLIPRRANFLTKSVQAYKACEIQIVLPPPSSLVEEILSFFRFFFLIFFGVWVVAVRL